jgi:tetratricopeptide (TPR) repeat protein
VTATASRILMLAAENEESIRLGEEALEIAEQFGLDGVKASALVNVGSSRSALGGDEGLTLLREAIEAGREANEPFEMCRAMGNLASWHWARGELSEPLPLWRDAEREAEHYGQKGFARWFRAVSEHAEYELGEWDAAMRRVEAFLAEVEAGSPHYLAAECYMYRALMRLGRGDGDGAASDADQALAWGHRVKDPQALYPACAIAAHVFMELGDRERALAPADEFLAAVAGGRGLGFAIAAVNVLGWTARATGRGPELADALQRFAANPWARAAISYGRGDPVESAEILAGFGAVTSEAYCRLAAARMLVDEGRRAEADAQLQRALAFYRSVGARRYVREGESLLAVSA